MTETDRVREEMKPLYITVSTIAGSRLIGDVKTKSGLADLDLVREVEALMEKYKVNYMWFAWNRWEIEEE
ncbi:hypothetical protein LCGC14_2955150 [marine sediment metagenome]|uniref:Uncharacterized protein n=1 Tax=marine sediment metagenome TaxID=412755 RepID=A0A0F8ZLP2_9ZZZZ